MAGLQYNFFPTDFFYPPRPVKVDTLTTTTTTTQKTISLPLQIQKREATITDDLNRKHHPASLVLRHSKHGNKSSTPMNKIEQCCMIKQGGIDSREEDESKFIV